MTDTGSTNYIVSVDGSIVTLDSYDYSSSDCSGSSVSDTTLYSETVGCDSQYYGAEATTQPMYDSNSPFTNNIAGIGDIGYGIDNPDFDTNYITSMSWVSLNTYYGTTEWNSCTLAGDGDYFIYTCVNEVVFTSNQWVTSTTCAGDPDYDYPYYFEVEAEFDDDPNKTGDDDWSGVDMYTQLRCSGGTYTADFTDSSTSVPTYAPTYAPTVTEDNKDDSSSCFAGGEMITLESGVSKPIAEIVVGDRILAANAQGALRFSDVIAVPHAKSNYRVMFNEISLANGADIRMTSDHLLPVAALCGTVAVFTATAAKDVTINACVMTVDGQSAVVSNDKVAGNGIYTIVTNEEYVVVNGVIASPFAASHAMGNTFYNVYRAMYNYVPGLFKSSLFQSFHSTFAHVAMKTW